MSKQELIKEIKKAGNDIRVRMLAGSYGEYGCPLALFGAYANFKGSLGDYKCAVISWIESN